MNPIDSLCGLIDAGRCILLSFPNIFSVLYVLNSVKSSFFSKCKAIPPSGNL